MVAVADQGSVPTRQEQGGGRVRRETPAPPAAGLLPETFVHLSGIGAKTEQRLWRAGIASWDDLRTTPYALRPGILEALEASAEALGHEDVDFFFSTLPPRDRWRAFADFGSRFLAVDIETTGMSVYDQVTVIGVEHDGRYQTFIAGSNLDDAAELINDADGLITFNGALFDLPFIQRTFPNIKMPPAHVDLRFLARRVGWAGSLKTVEELAELRRAEQLTDISGYGATVLWSEFDGDGDLDALQRLVLYNAADTCVLRPLAEFVTDRLRDDLEASRGTTARDAPTLFSPPESRPRGRPKARSGALDPLPTITRSQAGLRVGAITVKLPAPRGVQPEVTLPALRARMMDVDGRVVGIDLTGSEERPSGWALLQGDAVITGLAHRDAELLEQTIACAPRIVSIDSPLSIPAGRDCTDDACACRATGGITRHCERELKKRGVNVYPCLIQSMQALTRRGMRIATELREAGIEVIESYPGAAQDIMRIPRKRASQERLLSGLVRLGVRGIRPGELVTHDELDAVTSAVVGVFYLADAFEALGAPYEDSLIVPRLPDALRNQPRSEDPSAPFVLAIVGQDADSLAERAHPDEDQLGDADGTKTTLMAVATPDEFRSLVADIGPRARGFYVAPPGSRLKRRPSLFDDHRCADRDDLEEALVAWMSTWMARPACR